MSYKVKLGPTDIGRPKTVFFGVLGYNSQALVEVVVSNEGQGALLMVPGTNDPIQVQNGDGVMILVGQANQPGAVRITAEPVAEAIAASTLEVTVTIP